MIADQRLAGLARFTQNGEGPVVTQVLHSYILICSQGMHTEHTQANCWMLDHSTIMSFYNIESYSSQSGKVFYNSCFERNHCFQRIIGRQRGGRLEKYVSSFQRRTTSDM